MASWRALDVVWLIIAMVFVFLAYGAWNIKSWAWILGVGLTSGSILLEVFGLPSEGQPLVGTLISMAISAVVLVLLFRPEVKAAFGRA